MLKIVWDDTNGDAVPDGEVAAYVDNVIAAGYQEVTVGCETLINEFRLRVNKGQLKSDEVMLVVFGEVLEMNKSGRLNKWPRGFCDLIQNQLISMVYKQ